MTEATGQWEPVDGESFANGKVRDVTVIYEYAEIYEALLETLMECDDTVEVDYEIYADIGEFLNKEDIDKLYKNLEMQLQDDEYGYDKHERLVSIFLDEHLPADVTYELEYQQYD